MNLLILSCPPSCGACCQYMRSPPFLHGPYHDEEWTDFKATHPELAEAVVARVMSDADNEAPCSWFDQDSKQCKHYEIRPSICRTAMRVGSLECGGVRQEIGLEPWVPIAEAVPSDEYPD